MISNILLIATLGLTSLIPIIIWGYVFSYFESGSMNRKRFSVGIVAGVLSVFPLLYFEKITEVSKIPYLNPFSYLSHIEEIFSTISLSISLGIIFTIIGLFSLLIGVLYRFRQHLWGYISSMLSFLFFGILVSLGILILGYIFDVIGANTPLDTQVTFQNIIFNSTKLIIFYYLIIAIIEEATKHFNFVQSSLGDIRDIKTGVLYAIFIALGFSLAENTLYLTHLYTQSGFSWELAKLYFFRSVFSVMVHVLCSSFVAYYFSKAVILYHEKSLSFPYLKILFTGLFLSIIFHAIFDIGLTLGFSAVILLYFVGGYLYVSSIFYREEN